MPSFLTAFFEMKLVFEPLSSIAKASVKFPFWPLIFTFWTGQIAGTLVSPWTLWLLASWLSFADGSVSVPWSEFARGTRSLCKERWWCSVHLSQVVPSKLFSKLRMFWSKLCKSNWNCAWNLAFPVFISPIVWNMSENLHYESVYFKELHNWRARILLTDSIQRGGSCSVNITNILAALRESEFESFYIGFRLVISFSSVSINFLWSPNSVSSIFQACSIFLLGRTWSDQKEFFGNAFLRGAQRQFSGKYLFGRRFEI